MRNHSYPRPDGWLVALVVSGAAIFVGLPEFFFLRGMTSIYPAAFALVLLVITSIAFYRVTSNSGSAYCALRQARPIAIWAAAYVMLGALSLAFHGSTEAGLEELLRRASSALFLLTLTLSVGSPPIRIALIRSIIMGGWIVAVTVLMGGLHLAWDLDSCRAAGIMVNPNGAAYALSLALAVAPRDIPSKPFAWFSATILVALMATYSRSGWIVASTVYAYLFYQRRLSWRLLLPRLSAIFVLLAIGFFSLAIRDASLKDCVSAELRDRFLSIVSTGGLIPRTESPSLNPGDQQRLSATVSPSLNPGDQQRLSATVAAMDVFKNHWFIGGGAGWSGNEQRSHNMVLEFAAQNGFVGGLLFPSLLFLAWVYGRAGKLPIATIGLIGLFSHTALFDRYVLLVLAIVLSPMAFIPTTRFPAENSLKPHSEPNSI